MNEDFSVDVFRREYVRRLGALIDRSYLEEVPEPHDEVNDEACWCKPLLQVFDTCVLYVHNEGPGT